MNENIDEWMKFSEAYEDVPFLKKNLGFLQVVFVWEENFIS
jgi:hypothetical protein